MLTCNKNQILKILSENGGLICHQLQYVLLFVTVHENCVCLSEKCLRQVTSLPLTHKNETLN